MLDTLNDPDTQLVILLLAAPFLVFFIIRPLYRAYKRHHYTRKMQELASQIGLHIRANFMVQPCTRCYENVMFLAQTSLNARSVKCQCDNCGKSYWAPAANREALVVREWIDVLDDLQERYLHVAKSGATISVAIRFTTPEASLPFEQTTREPIPESARAEVWRRDSGKCVLCESKHNLEFDHIIPVSKGGSTSVKNLQLLCKTCNLKKHQRI